MSDWGALATILGSLLAVVGAIYGIRKTTKVDREKLTQQWATIFGEERQKIALELKEVKATADQLADQLRKTKEEYSESRIAHREAIGEKDDLLRQKDGVIRENLIQLHETQAILADTRLELLRARHELVNCRAIIETQEAYLVQDQEERRQHGLPPLIRLPAARPYLPSQEEPHGQL